MEVLMELQTKLTDLAKSQLFHLELIIEKGQETFIEVGTALMEIKECDLYTEYGTFSRYCK